MITQQSMYLPTQGQPARNTNDLNVDEHQNITNTDNVLDAAQSINSLIAESENLENLLVLPESYVSNSVVISAPSQRSENVGTSKRRKMDRIENERKYIHTLLDKNLLVLGETYKHLVPSSHENTIPCVPNLDDYLMLDVIFWDLQVECEKNGISCNLKCPECCAQLSSIPLGPRKRFMMRKLYCTEECVILITTMFRCSGSHKHELLGYDPRLLKKFLTLELPFLLFHRAGTTRKLAKHVLDSITRGVKISQLHDGLLRNYTNCVNIRRDHYVQSCTSYQEAQTASVDNLYFDDFPVNDMLSCPSLSLVKQCCLAVFEENEAFYKKAMESVTADNYFYMDDSFKLPSALQISDSSKVQEKARLKFKRILVIFNEKKQIMSWQLTKENSFSEVETMLEELKKRHSCAQLFGCFTNRCCEWTEQLRKLFGDQFVVKSNFEFLIEKLTHNTQHTDAENKEVQRKCLSEFKNIFQSNASDTMATTDDAKLIMENYYDFLSSWRNVKNHNGKSILPDESFREIVGIDGHIKRGCYSNIPPFCMQQRTAIQTHEFVEIHESLQKWISTNSRTGIPVAMAMVSLGFHEFNKKQGVQTVDKVSICKISHEPSVNPASVIDSKITKLNYFIDMIEKHVSENAQKCNRENNREKPDEDEEDQHDSHILKFLMYLKSYKSIVHFVPDILSTARLVPYFLSPFHLISVPYFLKTSEINTEYFNDVETLRSCINRLKFEHASDISEDSSNLLFCVVSFLKNIHNNMPKNTPSITPKDSSETARYFKYLLDKHGLDFSSSSSEELIESSKLLAKDRVPFHGLSTYEFVANLFHVVVLVVTNLRRFPVLPVYPRFWHPQSPQVLLLFREDSHIPILLQLEGKSSLTRDGEELPLDSKFKNFRCRCGRGKLDRHQQKVKCVTIKDSRYPSRCLCFRAGESCSSICDCRSCGNPHGARVLRLRQQEANETTEKLKLRRRNIHEGQQAAKKILSRVPIKPIKEEHNMSSWFFSEYILFEYALSLIADELNSEEDNLLTWSNVPIIIDNITDKYHHLVSVLACIHGIEKWLRKKEYVDIERRYTERQEDVTTNFDLLE